MTLSAPLVVVGSVNADIYVEIDKLPKESETIVAKSGHTFAGKKEPIKQPIVEPLFFALLG
jgi:hypothetical protein